jgi:hypothetical protein
MKLYMKIGTLSAQSVDALRLRKPPIAGQWITVREPQPALYPQPTRVKIDEVRQLEETVLYFATR